MNKLEQIKQQRKRSKEKASNPREKSVASSSQTKEEDYVLKRTTTILLGINVEIKEEIKNYIPALTEEESILLEDQIRSEGVKDALTVWENPEKKSQYILVDGHNRARIIQKLKGEGIELDYKIDVLDPNKYPDLESVKAWMIKYQLGKRNLSELLKTVMLGFRYLAEKNTTRNKEGVNQYTKASEVNGQNDHKAKSLTISELIGKEYGKSEKTVRRAEKTALALEAIGLRNPTLRRQIMDREVIVNKAFLEKVGTYTEELPQQIKSIKDVTIFIRGKVEEKRKAKLEKEEILFNTMVGSLKKSVSKLKLTKGTQQLEEIKVLLEQVEDFLTQNSEE